MSSSKRASGRAARVARAGRSVALVQLGCPKNRVDGEILLGQLEAAGYRLCHDPDEAELLIVNTCGFVRAAQEEAVDEILTAGRWKAAAPGRRLLVAGCLAERHGAELLAAMPEIDALLGPGRIAEVIDALDDLVAGRCGGARLGGLASPEPPLPRLRMGSPHSAYVKIAEGCNHRCAYCLIPRLRGPLRSRPIGRIAREIVTLGEEGVREAVLVAQDTTAYGRDLDPPARLEELLDRILARTGPEWIRLLYTHPARWSEALIDRFAAGGRLLPYVDLPIQHISDRVLLAMGRGRSGGRIRRLVERLRSRIPGLVLRTTVMTGHPGEGGREFRELLQFLREFPFDRLGAFAYSPEAGTRAARLTGRAEPRVAQERQREVLALQRGLALSLQRLRVGREETVLVEGWHEGERLALARGAGEAPEIDGWVRVDASSLRRAPEPGDFLRVRITRAGPYDVRGVPAAAPGAGEGARAARRASAPRRGERTR